MILWQQLFELSISISLLVNSFLPLSAANVLLVEDNRIARKAARSVLRSMSCQVEIANNGEEAILLNKQKSYDLILMDIGLGEGMDGCEVTSFIRSQEVSNPIPIVALTAYGGDEQNRQRCINAGINAVLSKPLTQSDVTILLNEFIHTKYSEPASALSLKRDLPTNDEEMFKLEHLPLFNLETAIKNCGSKKLVIELLSLIAKKEELLNDLQAMKKAFNKKNYSLVAKIAHKIKGGATYLGTPRMQFACQYLERYWKTSQGKLFNQLYTQAIKVISETNNFIKEWLENKG